MLFEETCGLPLPADSVIETRSWKGYRLNPRLRLVNIGSIEEAGTSRFDGDPVTTRISISGKSRR